MNELERLDERFLGQSSESAAAPRSKFGWLPKCTPRTPAVLLQKYVPITKWLPGYRHHLSTLKGDVIAGLTVGVMVVPQAMSYASVAGLKPVFGLYTAFIALIPYIFFGTSSHLITGPTAVMSLIVHNVVPKVWNGENVLEESVQWQHLAFTMAFFTGIVQFAMGLFDLGFVMNFISEPVIVGFTSAAALIIASTQISHLLGIPKCKAVGRSCYFYESVESTVVSIADGKADLPTCVMAAVLCSFLLFTKYCAKPLLRRAGAAVQKKLKKSNHGDAARMSKCNQAIYSAAPLLSVLADFGPLIAVIGSIALTYTMASTVDGGLNHHPEYAFAHCKGQRGPKGANGTKVEAWPTGSMVCNILPGLPHPGLPFPLGTYNETFSETGTWSGTYDDYIHLLSPVISIVLIGYMESMTIASTCFRKYRGFKIRPSQELVALGTCNFASSWFQGFSVTGSFSRTAVNADTGASSPISGAIAACIVGIVLLTLTQVRGRSALCRCALSPRPTVRSPPPTPPRLARSLAPRCARTQVMYFMPKVTLSAIVITAVIKLIDVAEAIKLWIVKKSDFGIFALVFVTTLVAGIDAGLVVGIATNWLMILLHLDPTTPFLSTPKCVINIIGRVDGVANRWVDMHAHDTAMRADALSGRGVSGVEPTTQWEIAFVNYWPLMMFVNSGYLTKVTTELSSRYTLRYIVMNWKHVEMADSTCIQTLEQRLGDMRNIVEGAQMIIVDPNELVMGILYDYAKAHHLEDRTILEGGEKNWWCLNAERHLEVGASRSGGGSAGGGSAGGGSAGAPPGWSAAGEGGAGRSESVNVNGNGGAEPKRKAPSLIVFRSLEVAYRYVSRADQPLLDGTVTPFVSRAELPTTYDHVATDDDFLSPGGTPVGLVIGWPSRAQSPLRPTASQLSLSTMTGAFDRSSVY
jgi:MFS superfamily sulfate permease-like transporter